MAVTTESKVQCKRLHCGRIKQPESKSMYLLASLGVFIIYFANVAIGAYTRNPVLGDVAEMVVLFAASFLFVVGILKKEADREKDSNS